MTTARRTAPRRLGILGHSVPGAALCFESFCGEGMRALGGHHHPSVTLDCTAMGLSMPAWEAGDLETVRRTLLASAGRLADAGCDFFVCPDNTAHLALECVGPAFPLPGLHIAATLATDAAERGFTHVGLLGTKWIMTDGMYPRILSRRGIACLSPDDGAQAFIQSAIFDELVHGELREGTRTRFLRIIDDLRRRGCDAVALSCTEIPLIVSAQASSLPVLDSTRLLARHAARIAMGTAPLPAWFGGRSV